MNAKKKFAAFLGTCTDAELTELSSFVYPGLFQEALILRRLYLKPEGWLNRAVQRYGQDFDFDAAKTLAPLCWQSGASAQSLRAFLDAQW